MANAGNDTLISEVGRIPATLFRFASRRVLLVGLAERSQHKTLRGAWSGEQHGIDALPLKRDPNAMAGRRQGNQQTEAWQQAHG
jgi:hypothetical protein